jgi:SET domain-containing protein
MINHSCIPNAAVLVANRRAILRALRDIKEGEEIEISYLGM